MTDKTNLKAQALLTKKTIEEHFEEGSSLRAVISSDYKFVSLLLGCESLGFYLYSSDLDGYEGKAVDSYPGDLENSSEYDYLDSVRELSYYLNQANENSELSIDAVSGIVDSGIISDFYGNF